ncbi:MAG: hypothetical protein PUC32_02290 [Oscillospiraceae bacterium]|nr:hypothetical protein [Oscillospiraceae bacterium]
MNEEVVQRIAEIIGDPQKTEAVLEVLQQADERTRSQRKQTQAEGIQAARARGVQFGRPKLKIPKNFPEIYAQYQNKTLTIAAASRTLKISRASFHRLVERYEESLSASGKTK